MPTSPAILLTRLKTSRRFTLGGLRPSARLAARMTPAEEALSTAVALGTVGGIGYGGYKYLENKVKKYFTPQDDSAFREAAAREAVDQEMQQRRAAYSQ